MFNQPLEFCQSKLELMFKGKCLEFITLMGDNSIKYEFSDGSFFTIRYVDNIATIIDYDCGKRDID